jgi:ammonium transporter Rh
MANVDNNDQVGDVEMTKVSYHPEHFVHVMEKARGIASSYPFATLLAFTQMLFCLFFLNFTGYLNSQGEVKLASSGLATDVSTYYGFYGHVAFMIFIGFGFLMSFLRRYAFSAIGFNMLISAFVFEWGMLVMMFFHNLHAKHWGIVTVNITWLIEGMFAAGAVMITFGAVLGKASPFQLLIISIFEVVIYGLNFYIGAMELGAIDVGGSIFVHSFGAYFGVGLALVLTPPNAAGENAMDHPYNASRTTSDLTAMFGALVLWLLWPSFNGALAPAGSQFRVVVNTVLALNGSCICAFLFSRILSHEKKFDMVHIQNATLAGGVAVGSSADLVIGPGAAILVGSVAGFLSVVGYVYVGPYLRKNWGLDDTCGVHNLHGMPGILGGLGGTISCATANTSVYGQDYGALFNGRTPSAQAGYQISALAICLGLSIVGGILTGKIVKMITNLNPKVLGHGNYPGPNFKDDRYWEVCHDVEKL